MKGRDFWAAAAFLLLVSPALANAGIPMLALAWPAHWIAFLPVVLIETAVVAAASRSPYLSKLWPVVQANLLSTLVGVPVAWLAMLVVQAGAAVVLFGLLSESAREADWVRGFFPVHLRLDRRSNAWELEAAILVLSVPSASPRSSSRIGSSGDWWHPVQQPAWRAVLQ